MHHRNTFRFVGAMRIAKFLHLTPQRVEAIQDRLQVDCYGVDGLQPSSSPPTTGEPVPAPHVINENVNKVPATAPMATSTPEWIGMW